MSREYKKRKRAESEEATRQRIAAAAAELHEQVGPARTTFSAVAERAGVQRATLYRHFPDEDALFEACSAHWNARNAPPDPTPWTTIEDPDERLRTALTELYGWYEGVEPMLSAVLRDIEAMPIIAELQEQRLAYLAAVENGLAAGWEPADTRLRATIGLALDFFAWRTLSERGLSRDDAIAVMASAVRAAAT